MTMLERRIAEYASELGLEDGEYDEALTGNRCTVQFCDLCWGEAKGILDELAKTTNEGKAVAG